MQQSPFSYVGSQVAVQLIAMSHSFYLASFISLLLFTTFQLSSHSLIHSPVMRSLSGLHDVGEVTEDGWEDGSYREGGPDTAAVAPGLIRNHGAPLLQHIPAQKHNLPLPLVKTFLPLPKVRCLFDARL